MLTSMQLFLTKTSVPVFVFGHLQGDLKKNRTYKSLDTIFYFNYSSFLFQVVVVDVVHEILQQ